MDYDNPVLCPVNRHVTRVAVVSVTMSNILSRSCKISVPTEQMSTVSIMIQHFVIKLIPPAFAERQGATHVPTYEREICHFK